MWRIRLPATWGLTIFGVEIMNNSDIIDPRSPTAQRLAEERQRIIQSETGWDRLKDIFRLDETGAFSPEIDHTLVAATAGGLAGFFLGGIPASKMAYSDFIDNNKASTFKSHFEAKEKLQFSVTRAMAVNGFRVAWRLALFTGSYTFFTTAVSVYRNKSSVLEYSVGGLLAGAIYKLPMGPRAMVPGGLVGGLLGTAAGVLSVGTMKLTGTTAEEIRYWRKGYQNSINREITSLDNRLRQKELDPIGVAHELGLIQKNLLKAGDNVELSAIPDAADDPAESASSENRK